MEDASVLTAEDKAYWDGYKDGIRRANNHYAQFIGTEAFAAIRRAIEVARDCDRMGAKCVPYSVTHYDYVQRAHEIRRAIRAAIGSNKT